MSENKTRSPIDQMSILEKLIVLSGLTSSKMTVTDFAKMTGLRSRYVNELVKECRENDYTIPPDFVPIEVVDLEPVKLIVNKALKAHRLQQDSIRTARSFVHNKKHRI